jgi:hypothetical protein
MDACRNGAMAHSGNRSRDHHLSFGAAEASFFADVNADNLIVSINHAKKAQRRRIQHERDIAMTVVKSAAVQISPVLYSREGTVDKVVEKIIALGDQGVQFATFPEAIVPYYPYFSSMQRPIENADQQLLLLDQAVTVPSETTHGIGDACAQAGIVVSIGVNERDGGTIYNTQLLFDADGTLIQHRRKTNADVRRAHDLGAG